jgi:hypothetical protein
MVARISPGLVVDAQGIEKIHLLFIDVILQIGAQQRRVAHATILQRHGQCLCNGAGHRFGIVGIDVQRALAFDCGGGATTRRDPLRS